MNPTPKVSILLATYNRSQYISKAIQSVINQSYQNWELLIWNDGSKDNTEDIIKNFSDERIKYGSTSINRGKAIGLNNLIQKATGEFISFLDDDDQYSEEYLSTCVSILTHHPRIDLLFTEFTNRDLLRNIETVGMMGSASGFRKLKTRKIDDTVFEISEGLLEGLITGNFIATDTVILRRHVLDDVGPFSEELKSSEDLEYWWRAAIKNKIFAFTTKNLMIRNWLQDGLCRPSISSFENQIRCFEVFIKTLPDVNREDLIPMVKKACRYPFNMLIRQYALNGMRLKAVQTFLQSAKYGISGRAVYLLAGALVGPAITRRILQKNF